MVADDLGAMKMMRGFGSRVALVAAIALAASGQTACAQMASTATGPSNQAAGSAEDTGQRFWYDGERRRELHVDPGWVADFRGAKPNLERRDEAATGTSRGEKDDRLAPGQSEVLRDETGEPRALPGGVIVRLREADIGGAPQLFAALGLTPVRALDPQQRTWLVDSPAGLESLTLANELHESGRFESAVPNWWRPRALK
ncbi:MAG TPA: hypothetical protein VGE10_14060 [Zeimonas sp.]